MSRVFILVAFAGAMTLSFDMGMRQTFGLLLEPMTAA